MEYRVLFVCRPCGHAWAMMVMIMMMQVYRVKDNVTYSVVIEEYDSEQGGWKPYTAEDVQVHYYQIVYT